MISKTSSRSSNSKTETEKAELPDYHNYDGEYFRMLSSHASMMPEMYFYLRTKQPPSMISYREIDGKYAMKVLCDYFRADISLALKTRSVNCRKNTDTIDNMIVQITSDIVLCYMEEFDLFHVMYTDKVAQEDLKSIERMMPGFMKAKADSRLNLLIYDSDTGGFRLSDFKLEGSGIDIDLHYNDDFAHINDIITKQLSDNKSKGIVLLHGDPGTGKTSYIRYLIKKLKKKLIYIPSSLARRLGDPDFIPFLIRYSGSVLIIEDAEDILKERMDNNNGTIANILNLSDGLLSDCLNIQIICTFNAPLTRIDKALLRKGRVIASYEFKPLSIDKSNRLLESLKLDYKTEKDLTLAEIFYLQNKDFINEGVKVIGFGR